VQSVLPFEPYYKLKGDLLKAAVERQRLPEGTVLAVVVFEDAAAETKAALADLGAVVLAEDRTPFGSALKVQMPPDRLAALAGLSGVQMIDRTYPRRPANDLTRPRLGVAESSTVTNNYLGLTGAGVKVHVVDSGVDLGHPDFTGRLSADPQLDPGALSLTDTDGHGTHVAGTLAGDGRQSDLVTGTNLSGSVVPVVKGQFRGVAPGASILSLAAISGRLSGLPDSQIQESAAENGALISNNSWRQLGNTAYDIVAASYDAAVRDAMPLTNGSQPVLFVFAAGNEGFGNDDGGGAIADTIGSPATAKNVITVGAIEQLRDLTNAVVICEAGSTNNCTTNDPPFEFRTDSDDQVASFSSRGNVGVGLEGEFGRLKPDVVAPGAFLISTRSTEWDTNAYYYPTNFLTFTTIPPVQPIFPGELFLDQRRIEPNVISLTISVTNAPGESGPLPEVGLPVYVRSDRLPTTNDVPQGTNSFTLTPSPTGVNWYFGVGNPTDQMILVQITYRIASTNLDPVVTKALQDVNAPLEPWYRYERGTSMAAPAISGTLALMQEYLVGRFGVKPSPALLKALLINGSRSVSSDYRYGDADVVNDQGWGIFNLPNILPAISNSAPGVAASGLHFYEQSVTRALATGQQQTRTVTVDPAAANERLRFTLVWTDPPGSPLVATKLVNDLDLVVTNLDTGEVYVGNNFPSGSDFTEWVDFSGTNATAVPPWDAVNNVENVFLPAFAGTNLSVTVVGRRINVNALPTHPDNTAQDYVLVISSGRGATASALTVVDGLVVTPGSAPVTYLAASFGSDDIQGVLLQNQTAGEHSPLLGSNAGINDGVNTGVASQWRFYGVTNTLGFTNAAFVTFLPATLSLPRMGVNQDDEENATRLEADIDLYVSQDPGLTTLAPAAINNAITSRTRGGTESIVLSNAAPGVYYVGVKSEDHEAANYSLFSAFSLLPFSEEDEGGVTLRGVPVPALIPDGSPQSPKAALVLGVTPTPINVRRVIVTNEITHQNIGDLVGNLSHSTDFAVLNNHTFPLDNDTITNFTYLYEDLGEGDIPGAQRTDGPGSLRNFSGKEGVGVWLLSMVDDALNQTGQVDDLVIRLERSIDTNAVTRIIQPFGWVYDVVEIPPDATNFSVCVDIIGSDPRPVELYILRGGFPNFTQFDLQTTIYPPGDCTSISTFDVPPLQPGTYYFGVFNPNSVVQEVSIKVSIEIGVDGRDRSDLTSFGKEPLTDDSVSYAYQFVEEDRRIAALEVGLVLQHPRVSDLVTHLVSPKGKRILLVENRGGTDDTGYGGGALFTNVFPTTTQLDPPLAANATTNILNVGANRGTLIIDYDFLTIPDRLRVYYDDQLIGDTGSVSGTNRVSVDFGPGLTNVLLITVNEGGNSDTNTSWSYTATVIGSTLSYLVLTENTNTTTPIKFAVPPLGGLNVTPIGPPIFADGFEGVAPGNYAAPATLGPWQVVANNVDVFATGYQGAPPPPEGSQFLDINGAGSTNTPTGGVIATTLSMLVPGRNYQLSFAYARNPDSVTNGVFPSAQVAIGSQVQEVVQPVGTEAWTNLVWQTLGIPFTATDTNLVLEITSLTGGTNGVLFDNFRILEAPQQDRYFLPEESLKTLIGDSAQGLWTLEMWDNRAGASNGPPTLVSWQLRFIYETVVQTPVPLEHGVPITNTIPAGGTFCLSVDVPNWALFATNELIFASAPVDVWFNQTALPSRTNVGNVQLLGPATSGTNTLFAASIPPLIPGERYFLCLTNPNAVEVTFAFQVEFDITALTNGIPLSSTLGTNRFGGFIRYFSYDVSTNNPAGLAFDLFPLTGDVDLVARLGRLPLPQFDYGSFNFGTNDENITLLPDTVPVPLTPGRWYLGVILADVLPVDYTIQATEYTNSLSAIITLTNAVPYPNSNLGVAPIEDYYRFVVTDPVARLQFEILGATADMTLLVGKGLPLPSFANFDYLSANPGTNDEYILVLPGSSPVVASAGEWFLTALNLSGQAADYAIKATQWAETGQPITVGPPSRQAGSFCFDWNSLPGAQYVVQAKVTLADTNWVDHSGTITATNTVTGYCVPLPSPYHFFRVIEGVAVDASSPAQFRIGRITVGPGGVTIRWQAPPIFQFEVQYSDGLPPVWNTAPGGPITSTDGTFTFVDPAPLPGTRFYRIVLLP
jgi:subtilisin family serine protease/subtilisin-like proprotein convertase family protein